MGTPEERLHAAAARTVAAEHLCAQLWVRAWNARLAMNRARNLWRSALREDPARAQRVELPRLRGAILACKNARRTWEEQHSQVMVCMETELMLAERLVIPERVAARGGVSCPAMAAP